jgi:hypothetical protein
MFELASGGARDPILLREAVLNRTGMLRRARFKEEVLSSGKRRCAYRLGKSLAN